MNEEGTITAIEQNSGESEVSDVVNTALERITIDSANAALEVHDIEGTGVDLVEVRASYRFSFDMFFFVPESMRSVDLTEVPRRPIVL